MSDDNNTPVSVQRGAATITIDLHELLDSAGWYDEDSPHLNQVVGLAAQRVANDMTREIREGVRVKVEEEVESIVADALAEGIQPTDAYGSPVGNRTTLREIILKQADQLMKTPARDSFGRGGETVIQKMVREEILKGFKNELTAAVNATKQEILEAMKTQAAEVITETIDRARRGSL